MLSHPLPALGAAPDHRHVRQVTPGLILIRLRWDDGPVRAWVLRLDLGRGPTPSVALGARRFPSYRATVRDVAKREGAIAAVNGDFGDYRPVHAFVRGGRMVQTGFDPREVVAFAGDSASVARPRLHVMAVVEGQRIRLGAWNSGPPAHREVVAFSPVGGLVEAPPPRACSARLRPLEEPVRFEVEAVRCGPAPMTVAGGVVLSARRRGAGARWIRALRVGEPARLDLRTRWPDVEHIQGGQPLLLDHGRVAVRRPCISVNCGHHPRTAVGVGAGCEDADTATRCSVLYVVVDGRRTGWSVGMPLVSLARLMRRIGASSALNVDGGGSSTMVIEGEVVNRPSLGHERAVPSAFLVLPAASAP
ncbi:MAG TPA: phosphodiester glycosidase family protein [Actinomycetota bacterium]|nr:phosphodiester glycosidase family protein [Actinomycetota bacterium]